MKKLFIVSVILGCFLPCFAQGKIKNLSTAIETMERGARRALTQATAVGEIGLTPIYFTNIKTQISANVSMPIPVESHASSPALLAEILQSGQVLKKIEGDLKVYIPAFLPTEHRVLYRGMRLSTLEELQHLLISGLEIKKTSYEAIYTAISSHTALWYAGLDEMRGIYADMTFKEYGIHEFPVLIRIPVTSELESTNPPVPVRGYTVFYKDIPSNMFELFVFVKIGEREGWYQVTLTPKKELNFLPVESYASPGWIED